jgi:hypothetical protein
MARKFEVRIEQWLPHIIYCHFEYESLNTLEIMKRTGGILRVLGKAKEQLEEINSVLEFLVKANFLKRKSSSTVHYYGIDFQNVEYTVTSKFSDFVSQVEQSPSKQIQKVESDKFQEVEEKIQPIQLTKNVYNLNISFAVEKLIEVKAGLLNL